MKGHPEVIEVLNEALCAELTAINQFMIHSKMCQNWGYRRLFKKYYHESIEEMKHAETVIDRILFLEGVPNMQKYHKICVGASPKEQFENDLQLELDAVALYNRGVQVAAKVGDNGSRDLLETLLRDEEEHVDWIETQLHMIEELGIQHFLAQQMHAEAE
ncbi:MAG: bacterioferritin [Candidatus Omnitrophica bacterium]|nr:Bacterioferritin [bacterium]NUN97445.1 bacterioferritin [Candidatus Omnitrophota bacterium]